MARDGARRSASTWRARPISSKKSAVTTASTSCRRRSRRWTAPRRRRRRASRAIALVRATLHRGRLLGSVDVRVHRAPRRAFLRERRDEPVADRQPAVGEVRRAAAVAAARPGRRRRAQPPARAARRPAVRDRAAASRATARDARVAFVWTGAAERAALVGRHRATSTSSTSRAWSSALRGARVAVRAEFSPAAIGSSSPGQAADVLVAARRRARSASSGSSRRRSPKRAASRRRPSFACRDRSRRAAADRERRVRSPRRRRCRASVDRARPLDARRRYLACRGVRGTIRSAAPSTLVSIVEFDRYQGKGVPEGRVSLSLRLTFRAADRTLTDDEVAERDREHRRRAAHGARRGAR